MFRISQKVLFCVFAIAIIVSCDDDDNVKPDLRPDMDYATLESDVAYADQFEDEAGASTVDLTEGNNFHKMFQALNYYSSSSITANTAIDASKLSALFNNTGNPFTDIATATINVNGAALNASGQKLSAITATSRADRAAILEEFESHFDAIAEASLSVGETASAGQAGKLTTFLLDERGIEPIQIIQKSLIGALQLDYISNVLLTEGLEADNHTLVSGKNYTQLEHNWDVAYGLLTLNPVYLIGSTNDTRATVEFALGSYAWEYNKANYAKIFPAFLKGRAAIVNNDRAELETQATFIRTELERAVINAALGYLNKWPQAGGTDASRAHAIGEGLGFVYSLRFTSVHGGDAAFSDDLIDDLVGSEGGFWDLDADKINAAMDAINDKFEL